MKRFVIFPFHDLFNRHNYLPYLGTNDGGPVLVRICRLVRRHIFDGFPIRRQRKQSNGLRLQLQQIHPDERRQLDARGFSVSRRSPLPALRGLLHILLTL